MVYNTERRTVTVSHSASIRTGWQITMGDIRSLADTQGVPDSAVVTLRHEAGDQREGTNGGNIITLTWNS